jgi:hypothetical protein
VAVRREDWSTATEHVRAALQAARERGERRTLPLALLLAARILVRKGRLEVAGKLAGASEALTPRGLRNTPPDRVEMAAAERELSESLPAEEVQALRAQGAELSAEDAATLALASV